MNSTWPAIVVCCAAVVALPSSALPAQPRDVPAARQTFQADVVVVKPVGDMSSAAGRTFVITHGMGGMEEGDRFHNLAEQVKAAFPEAAVYLVDWTPGAIRSIFGVPDPWSVARNIDRVGDEAAAQLRRLGIEASSVTLIGESFGNYVNARIASNLGGVDKLLAFNPAHELGGYVLPDLRCYATESWAFQTYSAFDTNRDIADHSLFLDTPATADPGAQHRFGIEWLYIRLVEGDTGWILLAVAIPDSAEPDFFAGSARLDGSFDPTPVPRRDIQPADLAPVAA